MDLDLLLRDWEVREEALSLEQYNQHAAHAYDEARMGLLASELETLAQKGLDAFPREALPAPLWLALVANAAASDYTRLNNELYRLRNEGVRVQVAGENVDLNNVRRFNQAHLREDDLRREAFDALMAKAHVLTPTLSARFSLSAKLWAEHGMTPLDVYLLEEQVTLPQLEEVVDTAGRRARPLFEREAAAFSEEILGKPFEAHDDMYVFRHSIYNPVDAALAEVDFEQEFLKLGHHLGFEVERVSIDGEAREGKYSSPICFGIAIPRDVRVLYQRTTPLGDYESFYHEMGHAVHFASVDPARSFAERRLIPNGVAEIFSTLFESVAMDPVYLHEDLGIPEGTVAEIQRRRRFMDLYFLAFYGANSMFKIRFWKDRLHEDLRRADDLYAELSERYMGVALPGIYWQTHHVLSTSDMYAPSYLLAHIRKSELVRVLQSRFGRAWWRDHEAGRFLREETMGPGAAIDLAAFSKLEADAYVGPILSGASST